MQVSPQCLVPHILSNPGGSAVDTIEWRDEHWSQLSHKPPIIIRILLRTRVNLQQEIIPLNSSLFLISVVEAASIPSLAVIGNEFDGKEVRE